MNIKLGKYRLTSNDFNIILSEKRIKEQGSNTGETYYPVLGYFGTLENAFKYILELKIRKSSAETLKEALKRY